MDTTVPSVLKFAAGIFLTIAFIGIAVFIYILASDGAKTSMDDYGSMHSELTEQKYSIYEDTNSSGSQVVNAIRKFKEDGDAGNIAIKVATSKNTSGSWYYSTFTGDTIAKGGNGDVKKIKESTSPEYINPSGKFQANIERDSNSVIRAIVFTQK